PPLRAGARRRRLRAPRGRARRARHRPLAGGRRPGARRRSPAGPCRRGGPGGGRRRGRGRPRGRGRRMNPWMQRLPPVWREAVEELWRRRLRTLLTLLGLIFGVGAIVAMQAVGEGSRREALQMVASLGLNNLIVEAKQQDEATLKEVRARSLGLSLADARAALAVVPGAEKFAAEKRIRTHSVFSDDGSSDAQASGISADFFELSSLQVGQGRALDADDEQSVAAVAVLGHQAAADLFPQGDAIGRYVKVN